MSLDPVEAGGRDQTGRRADEAADQSGPAAQTLVAPSPRTALILSLLVLPGLGQMLTGRKIRGVIMAGVLALWLPIALIKLGLDLNKIMPELMARSAGGRALGLADLQELMSPLAGGMIWLFLPLVAVWLWSLADSIMYLRSKNQRHSQ